MAAREDVVEPWEVSEKLDDAQNIFFDTDEDVVAFFGPDFDALADLNFFGEIDLGY